MVGWVHDRIQTKVCALVDMVRCNGCTREAKLHGAMSAWRVYN